MPEGSGPAADVQIDTQRLATQAPAMADLAAGITNIQTYLGQSRGDAAKFGQTNNGNPAGTQFEQSYDALRDSLSKAVQYASDIAAAISATAGTAAQTDQQSAQSFHALDEGR